jgi:molecular chaperone GrpE
LAEQEPPEDAKPPTAGVEPARASGPDEESALVVGPEDAVDPAAAEAYHQRARLAEDRLAEVLSAYRQLRLENEEHRDRTVRNLERRYQGQHDALLLRFMDILDNLDRALDAVQTSYADNSLIEGLILVRSQLLQTLQEEGLERIPVLGRPYDPHVSEAVGTEPVTDAEQHHLVLRELLRGYRLNGRVARASRVVLGEYRAAPAAPSPAANAVTAAPPPAVVRGDSLEDIIARVEAREAPADEDAPPVVKPGADEKPEPS